MVAKLPHGDGDQHHRDRRTDKERLSEQNGYVKVHEDRSKAGQISAASPQSEEAANKHIRGIRYGRECRKGL